MRARSSGGVQSRSRRNNWPTLIAFSRLGFGPTTIFVAATEPAALVEDDRARNALRLAVDVHHRDGLGRLLVPPRTRTLSLRIPTGHAGHFGDARQAANLAQDAGGVLGRARGVAREERHQDATVRHDPQINTGEAIVVRAMTPWKPVYRPATYRNAACKVRHLR
jgi:hypothetical protein